MDGWLSRVEAAGLVDAMLGFSPPCALSFDGQDGRLDGRVAVRKLPVMRPGKESEWPDEKSKNERK